VLEVTICTPLGARRRGPEGPGTECRDDEAEVLEEVEEEEEEPER
jgi:hypothetical protein